MKKPTSTILKEQEDDGIEVEGEKFGNKSSLFDRKIEIATEGLLWIREDKHLTNSY